MAETTKQPTGLQLLQTAQYFALHFKAPLTVKALEVAYSVCKEFGYTPGYVLHQAIHIAETKDLMDKVPTGITLWE